MQSIKSGKVPFRKSTQHFVENFAVVPVGKAITIQHHIDPYLAVID
uniref:Uncharacterized protein n=1 Tax=Candidatus Kentrum sp. TC TaxID=2126339 RepID=A0A450YHR7_9GAMM|nr:MAG: hypothetical protein BECKTC1821E_GA0114239_100943 [Candidatus Kentron sp. TC]VFK55569.1 MAG: hypothetical protein BECKTC1821F_GA0114240_100731 [Candidatus Kentron sp. TC]